VDEWKRPWAGEKDEWADAFVAACDNACVRATQADRDESISPLFTPAGQPWADHHGRAMEAAAGAAKTLREGLAMDFGLAVRTLGETLADVARLEAWELAAACAVSAADLDLAEAESRERLETLSLAESLWSGWAKQNQEAVAREAQGPARWSGPHATRGRTIGSMSAAFGGLLAAAGLRPRLAAAAREVFGRMLALSGIEDSSVGRESVRAALILGLRLGERASDAALLEWADAKFWLDAKRGMGAGRESGSPGDWLERAIVERAGRGAPGWGRAQERLALGAWLSLDLAEIEAIEALAPDASAPALARVAGDSDFFMERHAARTLFRELRDPAGRWAWPWMLAHGAPAEGLDPGPGAEEELRRWMRKNATAVVAALREAQASLAARRMAAELPAAAGSAERESRRL
jgi:hypothetical protein